MQSRGGSTHPHPSPGQSILSLRDAHQYFPSGRRQFVRAVDGVDLDLRDGQSLGLVGESGSGKTTIGRMIARLLEPTGGAITFAGQDVTHLRGRALRRYMPNVQVVFQDPHTSLNPRLPIGRIIAEPLRINRAGSRRHIQRRVHELLDTVGLSARDAGRMPSDFSGGQRQRIAICRAIALNPRIVVCDEAVSALDVSIQAKILNLLNDLQRQFALTYLFISHDLSVVTAGLRPDRGDVPGQAGGDRSRRRAVRGAAAPLHGGAAGVGARSRTTARDSRCCRARSRATSRRRAAVASIPAVRVRWRSASAARRRCTRSPREA